MKNQQTLGIKKTLWIILLAVVSILALFFNKITTPRYLSDIELNINGLKLIASSDRGSVGKDISGEQWMLLVDNPEDKYTLDELYTRLKNRVKKKVIVVYTPVDAFKKELNSQKKIIPIINPGGEFLGYFSYPYDIEKMTVTLSSVVTHR